MINVMKYNPSLLSDEDLRNNFVARQDDLELLVESIAENTETPSNQHILIIGPRGVGKTSLVLRACLAVRTDEKLAEKWYPLVFAEESYTVSNSGDFWLEAIFHLAEQTQSDRWQKTYDDLKTEPNNDRLRERALGQLLDFADETGKKILLVVENINNLFGEQINDSEAWKLRHTLQNEARIMLLATATNRFTAIENDNKAMYDLFKIHTLPPISTEECNKVWENVAGKKLFGERIRPIQILTGGNLRLITIIAQFGGRNSFASLLDNLIHLVDEHTEYFKGHLDSLATTERRVYLALAELWDYSSAKQISDEARLPINTTSALLKRLEDRGALMVMYDKKKKLYCLSERMYNIYYLMRKRGKLSGRVKAAVRFMRCMYAPEEAIELLIKDAETLGAGSAAEHRLAFEQIIGEIDDYELKLQLLKIAQKVPLFKGSVIGILKNDRAKLASAMVKSVLQIGFLNDLISIREQIEKSKVDEALNKINDLKLFEQQNRELLIDLSPQFSLTFSEAQLYLIIGDHKKALAIAKNFTRQHSTDAESLNKMARLFCIYGGNENILKNAYLWAEKAASQAPQEAVYQHVLSSLATTLKRKETALTAAQKYTDDENAIEKTINEATALFIQLAKAGYSKEAQNILIDSPSAQHLEPLIAALKLYNGEKIQSAHEIYEVAQDIVKRITNGKPE